jgi:hypothetical protein
MDLLLWLFCTYINPHGGIHTSTGCPTTYQIRQFFDNFTTNENIAQQLGAHYRHILLHFSPTNILLFKSRCNIFIGYGIIKELLGLVGSGTPYISCLVFYVTKHIHDESAGSWPGYKRASLEVQFCFMEPRWT